MVYWYSHTEPDTAAQCKSEDIVSVVWRYRLKNFQLLFCDCGGQGLSISHNYSSRCEISTVTDSNLTNLTLSCFHENDLYITVYFMYT